jgi:hypothetical protein
VEQFFGPRIENFRRMINAFSPADGILRPADISQGSAWWKRAQEAAPGMLWTQTMVNEGRIACALERYRLAHGQYPETPDDLVPQYLDRLPRDIINGAPLKYGRTADGSFLLYSVGWNETDDGGKAVSNPARPSTLLLGDWVWSSISAL